MASVLGNLNERVEILIKDQLNGLLSDDDLSELVKEKVDVYLEKTIPERIASLTNRFFASQKERYFRDEELDCYFERALLGTLKKQTDSFMEAIKNDPRWAVSINEKGHPIIGDFLKEVLAIDPSAIPDIATTRNALALARNIVHTIASSATSSTFHNGNYDQNMQNLANNLYNVIDGLTKHYEKTFVIEPKLLPPAEIIENANDQSTAS